MAQEQKEFIDRTFVQFMQPDLGFRTGVMYECCIMQKRLLSSSFINVMWQWPSTHKEFCIAREQAMNL